jgi:hypothetical protein
MAKMTGHVAPKQKPITMEATYREPRIANAMKRWPTHEFSKTIVRIKGLGKLYFFNINSNKKLATTLPKKFQILIRDTNVITSTSENPGEDPISPMFLCL